MIIARKAAHERMDKSLHARMLAKKAWKLSVIARKHAQDKRAAAIKRKLHLVAELALHATKAHKWHGMMKEMHLKMLESKKIMLHTKSELTRWTHTFKEATEKHAKERAHEKMTQLKIQLKERVEDHEDKLIKEKNLKTTWLKLKAKNAHLKKMITVVKEGIAHHVIVYHKEF